MYKTTIKVDIFFFFVFFRTNLILIAQLSSKIKSFINVVFICRVAAARAGPSRRRTRSPAMPRSTINTGRSLRICPRSIWCSELHCTVSKYTALHCTALHCTAQCTALHCTALQVDCTPNTLHCGGTGGCMGSVCPLAFTYASLFGVVSRPGTYDSWCLFVPSPVR